MASADITTKDTIVKGVNSENNYVRSEAHILDGTENSGILAADTHDLFVIPKGNALVGLKVIALASTTSGGSATVQFKAKVGTETATAVGSAIAKANLAAGFVHNLAVATLAYSATADTTSSGSATVTFKAKVGTETATAVGSAIGKANLAAGFVQNLAVATLAYSATAGTTIEMTVGTAALTAVKLLVIAEYIPVDMFMNAG